LGDSSPFAIGKSCCSQDGLAAVTVIKGTLSSGTAGATEFDAACSLTRPSADNVAIDCSEPDIAERGAGRDEDESSWSSSKPDPNPDDDESDWPEATSASL
jgi:hypothetical protein